MESNDDLMRTAQVVVRLRPSERRLLELAAQGAGERLTTWTRAAMVRAARREIARRALSKVEEHATVTP